MLRLSGTMNLNWMLSLLVAAVLATACSSEQVYNAGGGWRRNECNALQDQDARQRCLKNADKPYEDYKKETDRAKQ